MIDRRAFMAGLGAALAAPLAAGAQPETRVYRVGILLFTDRQAVPGQLFSESDCVTLDTAKDTTSCSMSV